MGDLLSFSFSLLTFVVYNVPTSTGVCIYV